MIVKFQIKLNGSFVDVPPPRNWKEGVMLQLIFTDPEPSATLQKGGFEWVNTKDFAGATELINVIRSGTTGGMGIGQAVPLQIFIPGTTNVYLFQGGIDLTQCIQECDRIQAPIKYINAIDWFHTLSESITYLSLTAQGLADAGISPPSGFSAYIGPPNTGAKYSYKVIPYVVTQETDIPQAILLIMEEISMFAHIKTAIANTVSAVKAVIAAFATAPPFDVASAAVAILGLIGQIAWDALLIISLIGNIEMLINQCGLLIKYKYGMTCSDIIHAGFDFINNYLGTPSGNPITFSSSIFDSGVYANTTIIPRKIYKENSTDVSSNIISQMIKGGIATRGTEVAGGNLPPYKFGGANVGTYGYPDWNLKETFQNLGQVFNAKNFFIGGQVRFEEQHYFVKGNYKLPNVDKPGNDTLNIPNTKLQYNWNELRWNYRVSFQTDSQDERTMIVYTGTSCNVCTQPNICDNPQYVLPSPGLDMVLPFALAKRKEYLNFIENVVNDILNFVGGVYNAIVSVINGILSVINFILKITGTGVSIPLIAKMPSNILQNGLIGCLEVSNDTWSVPKIFIGVKEGNMWKLDPNQGQNKNNIWNNPNVPSNTPGRGEGNMSAWALMNQFHGKNLPLFTPVDQNGNKLAQINNQWLLYKQKRFPMCASDFTSIFGNNMFVTSDGKIAKFDKLLFNVYDGMAQDVEYRISQLYTTNLKTIITIDGN